MFRALVAGLRRANDDVELEQAPHGIESWREIDLHVAMAQGAVDAGFFVAREQRYPGHRFRRQRTSGRRCDLVVSTAPLRLEQDVDGPAGSVGAAEAAWIEVKLVKQFHEGGRVNFEWEQALSSPPLRDVERLARELGLGLRLVVMIAFVAAVDIARHDLAIWRERVLQHGLVVSDFWLEHFAVVDRRGHAHCVVAAVVVAA